MWLPVLCGCRLQREGIDETSYDRDSDLATPRSAGCRHRARPASRHRRARVAHRCAIRPALPDGSRRQRRVVRSRSADGLRPHPAPVERTVAQRPPPPVSAAGDAADQRRQACRRRADRAAPVDRQGCRSLGGCALPAAACRHTWKARRADLHRARQRVGRRRVLAAGAGDLCAGFVERDHGARAVRVGSDGASRCDGLRQRRSVLAGRDHDELGERARGDFFPQALANGTAARRQLADRRRRALGWAAHAVLERDVLHRRRCPDTLRAAARARRDRAVPARGRLPLDGDAGNRRRAGAEVGDRS